LPNVGAGRIAVLYGVGTITSGESNLDSPAGIVLGSRTFVEWVRRVRVDPSIDAVVVRIDSPGGSAIASEVIWRELMLTRDVKPLVVSLGDVAASGGYYIAAPAHTIVALRLRPRTRGRRSVRRLAGRRRDRVLLRGRRTGVQPRAR
jgi:protease-4